MKTELARAEESLPLIDIGRRLLSDYAELRRIDQTPLPTIAEQEAEERTWRRDES